MFFCHLQNFGKMLKRPFAAIFIPSPIAAEQDVKLFPSFVIRAIILIYPLYIYKNLLG